MSWIKTINYKEATGPLRRMYDKVKGPDDNVDNVLAIHSLRPHTLKGHMTLYKCVLHHSGNTLPKWYLEAIGVYVSHLNKCDYCVAHHAAGLRRLVGDDSTSSRYIDALVSGELSGPFTQQYILGLRYAALLTLSLAEAKESHVTELTDAGFSQGEVLEINQVASYFNYVNRMVVGLGVTTDGDVLGLSPGDSEDPDNWSHA